MNPLARQFDARNGKRRSREVYETAAPRFTRAAVMQGGCGEGAKAVALLPHSKALRAAMKRLYAARSALECGEASPLFLAKRQPHLLLKVACF